MLKTCGRRLVVGLIALVGITSLSCNLLQTVSPTPTQTGPLVPEQTTPTPTPVPPLQVPDTPTAHATPAPPTQGEIELRFIDPASQEECVAHFPFDILGEGDQRKISGSGVLDCSFAVQQCGEGVCVMYHSEYDLDGDLSGVILGSSASYPEGALDAGLAGTFTMKQYWTDIPPETVMAFTEENPFEVSSSDIIPLFFHFVDGATQEVGNSSAPDALPWVFTLHLH